MARKRRRGRKLIIAPDGGDARASVKQRPDERLICALARAHLWKRMLDEGRYRSAAVIAEAERVTRNSRFVHDRRYLAARSYIDETVRPALSPIADSYRPHLLQIADDLASQLSPFA